MGYKETAGFARPEGLDSQRVAGRAFTGCLWGSVKLKRSGFCSVLF